MAGGNFDTFGVLEAVAVTPSDAADVAFASPGAARGLYVGTSGDVAVQPLEGSAYTMQGLASGIWHPVVYRRVLSTGTTAAGILAGR